jgi:hypothetical protein
MTALIIPSHCPHATMQPCIHASMHPILPPLPHHPNNPSNLCERSKQNRRYIMEQKIPDFTLILIALTGYGEKVIKGGRLWVNLN